MNKATAKQNTEATSAEPIEYVVTIGAVSLSTGRKIPKASGDGEADEVLRLLKGDTVTAHPDDPRIAPLIAQLALAPAETWTGRAPTVRDMARAMGGTIDQNLLVATTPTAKEDKDELVDPRNVIQSEDGWGPMSGAQ